MKEIELIIIGGGCAGMSAAISAREAGCNDILILERSEELGGILNQCIHNGFGLQVFQEELSGPAFAQRLIDQIKEANIKYALQTTVISVDDNRVVTYVNPQEGYTQIQAKAIIFACGCYERTRGAIQLPGTRVKGVYSAGSAQRYLNMENICVGKKVFILGSGDIGLIMARRMSLEGAQVVGVAELMPYSNGLTRNIVQCLEDFNIPLYLSHTIVDIKGKEHVEAVTIAKVDEHLQPIFHSEQTFEVDTLLLSVGLVPETTLLQDTIQMDPRTKGAIVNERMETSIPHIYACGNGLHVHDLVDYVAMEARLAGTCAIEDITSTTTSETIPCLATNAISYVLPQCIHTHPSQKEITFSMRVQKPMKHVEVVFSNEKETLKTIPKQVVLPAEMLRIKLPSTLFANSKEIHVEVRELK